MGFENFKRDEDIKISSERNFGLVFAGVFLLVALLPLFSGHDPRKWALWVAVAFVAVAVLAPKLLAPFNRLWAQFGLLLHRITSPLVLGIMFFVVITPMGWIMRALGKDLLRLKLDPAATSYWIARTPPGPTPESLKDQF